MANQSLFSTSKHNFFPDKNGSLCNLEQNLLCSSKNMLIFFTFPVCSFGDDKEKMKLTANATLKGT